MRWCDGSTVRAMPSTSGPPCERAQRANHEQPMSLTTGRGPLSAKRAGRFSAPIPEDLVYVEPFPRRVRGLVDGRAVIDSERVLLVHRTGQPPVYAFPAGDVREVEAQPEPDAPGHVRVRWD